MKTLITVTLSMFCSLNVLISQPWTEVTTGVTTPLTSVSKYDPGNCWVCGSGGVVLRCSNLGYNWSNVSGNGLPSNISLVNIFGVSASTALTAGYIGSTTYVYKTSNSGANWSLVFTQANGFINGIWFNGSLNGFMTGDPVGGRWSLWKTSNGGTNWDSTGMYLLQRNGELGWNNSLYRFGNETWFGTDKARIYHSTTGGAPWDSQLTGANSNIRTIFVKKDYPPYIGFAGGDSLSRTTNNGAMWNISRAAGSNSINGFAFLPSGSFGWYSRFNGNIYFKREGDSLWSTQYTAPAGNYLHLSAIRTDMESWYGNVFAVRDNGGISRLFYTLENINIVSKEIPETFSLSQNYPNPFNPVTNIGFQIIKSGLVQLAVYDALGKEIASLVNQQLQPGTYEAAWDASAYPSGVYFYKLTANGFTDTKKMVLIK